MESIIKYRSNDGSEHRTEEAALKRDVLHSQCVEIMAPLGEVPAGVTDGKGWLQHDLETVNTCKDQVLELCRTEGLDKHFPAFKNHGRDCHPMSIIGRILDDTGGPLSAAWSRFACIDPQGREHQQPYFAYTNGPLPEHACIEDRRK